ncbi:small-conductance mechanosensitive channel [Salirhabdus euzebyi]|uniref:Small-conductance mechanosensitive channel n=1 Tax=Salirhabdus euzebyi TaxID=394506 RepID=A0A841PSQ3_9BACI|nr:hypothetical protein [Salirhabdus euzebyi]MBB6451839.1 small-conductance mechanosensitive channel [Salirhabdus euzebyi]
MEFLIYLILSWISITIYALLPKKLKVVEVIFVFFVGSILVMNLFTIVEYNFELITLTTETDKYFSLLLYRSVILPVVLLTFITILQTVESNVHKWGSSLFLYGFILLVEYLGIKFAIYFYTKWSFLLSSIDILLVFGLCLFIFRLYKRQEGK